MESKEKKLYSTIFIVLPIILTFFGIAAVMSASFPVSMRISDNGNYFFYRQVIWVLMGWIGLIFVSRIDYKKYMNWYGWFYIAGLIMLLAVIMFGAERNGAKRWISVAGMSIQPAEFIKIIFVVTAAAIICRFKEHSLRELITSTSVYFLMLFYVAIIMVFQKDFGTSIQLFIIAMTMLFMSGIKFIKILFFTVISGAGAVIAIITSPHRISRIKAFVDKTGATDAGYQLKQSVLALGSGGFFGEGYGNGKQKYYYLPEPHTDFIFASIGEELGFIGLFLIIIAFIIIFVAGINFVMKKKNEFGKLVAFGIVIMITVQALINMYVATGLFPTKGMPLPFISFGGSAIIGIMVSCGVLLNIIKEDETE
mgnify:CR=1 FL=1